MHLQNSNRNDDNMATMCIDNMATMSIDTMATVSLIQYSSQVTSRVHALRGMRAREKLARAQGALEELRAKLKPLES